MSHKLVSLYIGDGEYYTRTDADKVIAEKDKEIAELQKQVHDYAQGLYVITESYATRSTNVAWRMRKPAIKSACAPTKGSTTPVAPDK